MSRNVKLNYAAFQSFRRTEGLRIVKAEAEKIAGRANAAAMREVHVPSGYDMTPRYEASAIPGPKGATAHVYPANRAAGVDNALHNTLAKAVGGGG